MKHTSLFAIESAERRHYAQMLVGVWPHLKWRHAGLGVLQAYIFEGEAHELRAHVWHPSLVAPGMAFNGLCHDHRFMMRSHVLVGSIQQTEFEVTEDPKGPWESYEVVHAREAKAAGGSYHSDPTLTGKRYHRHGKHITVLTGQGYFFERYVFHETVSHELTVTLVEKSHQNETIRARILGRAGVPIVNAFENPLHEVEWHRVLDQALGELQKGANP